MFNWLSKVLGGIYASIYQANNQWDTNISRSNRGVSNVKSKQARSKVQPKPGKKNSKRTVSKQSRTSKSHGSSGNTRS